MRVAVVDVESEKAPGTHGLAGSWLAWEVVQAGGEVVAPGRADVVLMTAPVPDLRLAARCGKHGAPVVVGGNLSPAAYGGGITAACVGDGRGFVGALCSLGLDAAAKRPEVWVPGETRAVEPADCFPFDVPPLRMNDGAFRVWESVGCRSRCLFCQTGWGRRFAQNPDLAGLACRVEALRVRGEKAVVVTNDGGDRTALALTSAAGQKSVSARASSLLRADPARLPRMIRIGVEGVSARLRSAVRKPVSREDLLGLTLRLGAARKDVRWFMIAGLPGETDADWEELRETVLELRARRFASGVNATVELSFTAFCPAAATPLGVLPLVDGYGARWEAFAEWYKSGRGFARSVRLARPRGEAGRLEDARLSLGCGESDLRRGFLRAPSPNWRIQYPHATPEKLRKIARAYAAEVGLALPAPRGVG